MNWTALILSQVKLSNTLCLGTLAIKGWAHWELLWPGTCIQSKEAARDRDKFRSKPCTTTSLAVNLGDFQLYFAYWSMAEAGSQSDVEANGGDSYSSLTAPLLINQPRLARQQECLQPLLSPLSSLVRPVGVSNAKKIVINIVCFSVLYLSWSSCAHTRELVRWNVVYMPDIRKLRWAWIDHIC